MRRNRTLTSVNVIQVLDETLDANIVPYLDCEHKNWLLKARTKYPNTANRYMRKKGLFLMRQVWFFSEAVIRVFQYYSILL